MLNKVELIGRLGADSETLYSKEKASWCNFRVATEHSWVGSDGAQKKKVEWHRCVIWGKLAEAVGEYLTKGRLVYVSGSLRTREWKDKNEVKHFTTEIMVKEVKLLDSKK